METVMEIVQHPATWAIIGIIIKAVAPAWVPFLGIGKKLVEELTQLHEESKEPNVNIKANAVKNGMKAAEKHLLKKLS